MQNPSVIRTRPRKTTDALATRELPWTFVLLVIICACVVGAGFFLAARQHFNSIDYGIKNSKLREQLQNLEAEKRRLLLAREVAHSPVAMRKAARGLGLRETGEVAQTVAVSAKPTEPKSTVANPEVVKASASKAVATHAIVKTVLTAASTPRLTGEIRSRIADTSKAKKEKTEVAALIKFK